MNARRASLIALSVALALAARWSGTFVLEDDAGRMVGALCQRAGGIATWYHAAYLVIGTLFVAPFGQGYEVQALQWSSALCSALAVAFVVCAFRPGDTRGWLVGAALAASPGWWVNATRIELHGCQMMGAALLLLAALHVSRASTVRGRDALVFALGVSAALLCHRTNALLLPGAFWLASTGRSRRVWLVNGGFGVLGFLVATVVNARGESMQSALGQGRSLDVLLMFWQGFDVRFVWSELVQLWFPVLLVPLALWPRDRRAALPLLATALPALAFFACFGVSTRGGYFSGALVFLAALAVRDEVHVGSSRLPRPRVFATLAVCVFGTIVGVRAARGDDRTLVESVIEARLAAAAIALPDGGHVFSFDSFEQTLDGRRPGLYEVEVFPAVARRNRDGVGAAGMTEELVALTAEFDADGSAFAFDLGWHAWRDVVPAVEVYLGEFEDHLRARADVREVSTPFGDYLVRPALDAGAHE